MLGFAMSNSKEIFTGKENGVSWERFEEMVCSWGRERYGDKFGRQLWRDELLDLESYDPVNELHKFEFDRYCHLVYDALVMDSPKYADNLYWTERFWTRRFQAEMRAKLRERLFCYLENDNGR